MCITCGCGHDGERGVRIEGATGEPHHHQHRHHDDHHHHHAQADDGAADSGRRLIELEADLLGKNDRYAAANRRLFAARGQFALNLVSSPGSGKTTLLVRTIEALKARLPMVVIEGDQETSHDADRIRATGVPAVQINTGKACHLDAHMVGHALERLPLARGGLVFIENVGNLVCPAAFDLGEAHKVAVISVTEGDDKPLKYPDMFAAADLLLINKIDLAPYVAFDIDRCVAYARRVNPAIAFMPLSATTGEGLDGWLAWLEAGLEAGLRAAEPAAVTAAE